MKSIRPLGSRVVVKREDAPSKKGSILLPETSQEKPKQGTVIAVGPGSVNEKGKLIPVELKVGAKVLFSSYGGSEYKVDDETWLILSEDDVLAVVN